MSREQAFLALSRFGMGAGPGDVSVVANDPRGWVLAQLDSSMIVPPPLVGQPSSADGWHRFVDIKRAQKMDPAAGKGVIHRMYVEEAIARTNAGAASTTPVFERLVRFWSNHFTVSIKRFKVAAVAGAFEREAIRPHVLGKFQDMLRAVVRHPAMLIYLDNAQSVGPNSPIGRRTHHGLNENLAREMMELHTVGVNGGYDQHDVEALARILTGWGVAPADGAFRYQPRRHEPGRKVFLGRDYDSGMSEGEEALSVLSHHPTTAHFLATKLARHFTSDDPPPTLVKDLAATFLATDGDLLAVTRCLVARDEPWASPFAKLRTPDDLVVAALKALHGPLGRGRNAERVTFQSLALMGQAPWTAPSPAGWPDKASAWLGPEAMMRRIEWSKAVAHRVGRAVTAPMAGRTVSIGTQTLQVLSRTHGGADGLFVVLASREFQRR